MTTTQHISHLLSSNEAPAKQWVDDMTSRYPYFALPLLLHVKHSGDQEALQHLSVMSPDRRDLAVLVGNAPAAFAHFYPTEETPETLDLDNIIDKFLENYSQEAKQKEIDAISQAIFNPLPDYADILAAQNDDSQNATNDKEDQLISSFIAKSRQQEREAIAQAPEVKPHVEQVDVQQVAGDAIDNSSQNDPSLLSESLAKMYIARKKYSKALEIIESINLNFPKKSIYFADQIRFLRKLVLNETLKNKL